MRGIMMALTLAVATLGIGITAHGAAPEGYRWHEGRWWYQMPDQRWLYWESNRWNECGPTPWVAGRMTYEEPTLPSANFTPAPAVAAPIYSGEGAMGGYAGGSGGSWANAAVGSWGGNYFGQPLR